MPQNSLTIGNIRSRNDLVSSRQQAITWYDITMPQGIKGPTLRNWYGQLDGCRL